MPKNKDSRREFIKKISAGTAGFSLGSLNRLNLDSDKGVLIDSGEVTDGLLSGIEEDYSPIFPIPRESEYYNDFFGLTSETAIFLPEQPGSRDIFLSRMLRSELAERYGTILKIKKTADLSGAKNYILIGSVKNPLIKEYASENNIPVSEDNPGPEGYFLQVSKSCAVVLGSDDKGAFYGLQSLRQLISRNNAEKIQCMNVKDWPYKAFRGIRMFIPGKENIAFYKRFISDFMALYKFNKVIMEVNACMRLDNHPELNAGSIEFAKDMNYTRRRRTLGPHKEHQDSAHYDAGDGEVLEKGQVADLVNYARQYYIDTIPEIPSLTHCYYLLSKHRELAEISAAEWPDTYCPSNPKSVELYLDVVDEYIDVMKPEIIHAGRDEWFMPIGVCERCKGKDYSELFVQDLLKIYNHLRDKNIQVAIWGDHLIEAVRGKEPVSKTSSAGYNFKIPGAVPAEMVKTQIPKDILIFNWFWVDEPGFIGEDNDKMLQEWGFRQVYGNLDPSIGNYSRRSSPDVVLGGAPSSWSATTEYNFGKDLLYDFLGSANLLWSTSYPDGVKLTHYIQNLLPTVRMYLKGFKPPSKDGDRIIPVDISSSHNNAQNAIQAGVPLNLLKNGSISINGVSFVLTDPLKNSNLSSTIIGNVGENEPLLPIQSERIPVDMDVSSLIFLHACASSSTNEKSYSKPYNFKDSADLLGWYKIVYIDGYVEYAPIRYGVNIMEWNLLTVKPRYAYCYEGDIVNCSKNKDEGLYFYSFEWENTRFGVKIKEVCLEGSNRFKNIEGKMIRNNAIILIALSCVVKREIKESDI